MLSVKTEGRLGNQLFQYAFIVNASKILSEKFIIDQRVDKFLLHRFFNIPYPGYYLLNTLLFSITGFKNFFTFHLRVFFYSLIQRLHKQKVAVFLNGTSPEENNARLASGTLYEGYFQSEKYFSGYAPLLADLLSIRPAFVREYSHARSALPQGKMVVVHVRRADYADAPHILPISYYQKGIQQFGGNADIYVFISDDPEFVSREFSWVSEKYISRNSEIVDLQFLMNADVCILSNSSFSWWGAWLNKKQEKKVIAPELWMGRAMGKEWPCDIIPPSWIQVSA